MRRIARLERSIGLVKARTSAKSTTIYLCSACRNNSTPFSTSTIRAVKAPYTEKIRQKIWGTDQPPGQKNPYGETSVFDQTKKSEAEETAKEEEEQRNTARVSRRPKKARPDMSSYEPATTWMNEEDGTRVPWVGGFGNWWKNNWDPEHQYSGFVPEARKIMTKPDEITAAFYRALVEVYMCKEAGLPLTSTATSKEVPSTFNVRMIPSETGVQLDFSGSQTTLDAFTRSLKAAVDETVEHEAPTESEEDVAADRSTVDPLHPESTEALVDETATKENPTESEEDVAADRSPIDPLLRKKAQDAFYSTFVANLNPAWRQVPLADPEIKFAVLKRVLQLTGIRIPDSAIQPSKTAGNFLSHLIKPPKPRKLAEAIPPQLKVLRNVKVSQNRVTPIHKEQQVGRWKLIQEELNERGLPVTGHSK
ncbi:hypothetical protein BDZ45DRAFT_638372 [Acephala macrosclerotiorum]|nr:hypothetical protein BDZ45DRAFT_638372 [Acephala macrosclerotiorum]